MKESQENKFSIMIFNYDHAVEESGVGSPPLEEPLAAVLGALLPERGATHVP